MCKFCHFAFIQTCYKKSGKNPDTSILYFVRFYALIRQYIDKNTQNYKVNSKSEYAQKKFRFKVFNAVFIFINHLLLMQSVAEFKEFERRFKFKPRFKYGWFHLKLYQMFEDLSRRLI